MRLLFVHQNFPAQFVHLARHYLTEGGHELVAITSTANKRETAVRTLRYPDPPPIQGSGLGYGTRFLEHSRRGEAVARLGSELRKSGFVPDVIAGHFGWGETLYLKDVWPEAKLLVYAEYFYGGEGSDTNFDPEFRVDELPASIGARARNASLLLSLASADRGIAPTEWQRSRFPAALQPSIEVIHDGIDTAVAAPNPSASVSLKELGLELRPGDEVITFVNRNLEPYRGYHIFMRALPQVLRERPHARVLIIGGNEVSYGRAPAGGGSWRDIFLKEVRNEIDLSRVHFVGKVPYPVYLAALQVSAVHVYLTYPFVLSWSLLEAMSAGCLIVASDTAPVREAIRHGENGLLTDFFDHKALALQIVETLSRPDLYSKLRSTARQLIVEKYDLRDVCLPRHIRLVERLAETS